MNKIKTRQNTWNKLVKLGVVKDKMLQDDWNLSGANLTEANLTRVNLSHSKLIRANLTHANLTASTLIKANLEGAILNGICLDDSNRSNWIITGVKCSYILRFNKKVVYSSEDEFEKIYTKVDRLIEFVLNIPLTESTSFIGKFISQSINYSQQSTVIDLKGIEALSDVDTKMTFNIFNNDFYETQKETIETILKDALNEYFKLNPIALIHDDTNDPVKEDTNGIISTRDSIPILYTHYQINPKAVRNKITEYYIKLGKTGEAIHNIITSIFK